MNIKRLWKRNVDGVCLMIAVIGIVAGAWLGINAVAEFWVGFHNVDLSYNVMGINYQNGEPYSTYIAYEDVYNTAGDTMGYGYAYILGQTYMRHAFQSMMWSALLLLLSGFLLGYYRLGVNL